MAKTRSTKPARRSIPILEQWIEVTIQPDGTTLTELFPPNDVLLEELAQKDPVPELVYRRLNFPAGVPPEYCWTDPPDQQTLIYGGGCVQRLTLQNWLEMIETEKSYGDGRIGPSMRGSVPRPKERGGCDCKVCKANEHLLQELGYAT